MTKVEKLDHFGRGIIYDNNKITFINNALPNEEIDYEIIKETKKYKEAKLIKIIVKSNKRTKPFCPFYHECGGCHLQHLKYKDTLEFKKEKLSEILSKYAHLDKNIEVIENENPFNYRNKLSLQIKNGKVGFLKEKTHTLIEIDKCLIAKDAINELIKDIKYFNLKNASITIRCNYNNELLISIKSSDKVNIDYDVLTTKHKIVGIVLNDEAIYGDNKFIDIIDKNLFQISYNSFFQINPYVTNKLFSIIKNNINNDSVVADLFCGVGNFSIVVSKYSKKVYGIEIVKNAILNALINKKMNKCENIDFCLGDANKQVFKIKEKIDTIILDPPRKGLTKEGLESILKLKPQKIIYISCDPMTLARDLKKLKENYEVKKIYLLDMFSYTYHLESLCILDLK